MKLTMTIVEPKELPANLDASKAWVQEGGSIGRFEGNDWVLPDPNSEISRVHARVFYMDNAFFIEDMSTNGVFVAHRQNRIERSAYALKHGDSIFIGQYEIKIAIGEDVAVEPPPQEPDPVVGVEPELGGLEDELLEADTFLPGESLGAEPEDKTGFKILPDLNLGEGQSLKSKDPSLVSKNTSPEAEPGGAYIPENWMDNAFDSLLSGWGKQEELAAKQTFETDISITPMAREAASMGADNNNEQVSPPMSPQGPSAEEQAAKALFDALLAYFPEGEVDKVLAVSQVEREVLFQSLFRDTFMAKLQQARK